MNIERAFVEEPNEWKDVDEDTFLLRTEWAGVYPKGTALQLLREKGLLRTPAYLFRLKGKHHQGEQIMDQNTEKAAEGARPLTEGEVKDLKAGVAKDKAEKKPRGYPLGTIRHYKNGEAFRRVEPPKGWEYIGKTGSDKVKAAEAAAREKGLEVIYDPAPEQKGE